MKDSGKRKLLTAAIGLLTMLSLTSCPSDDDGGNEPATGDLQVSSNSVILDEQNSATITVTSTTSWAVFSSASWLNITPAEGSGTQSVTITATENNTGSSARTASIIISDKAGKKSVSVSVTQNPPPVSYYIRIDKQNLSFEESGGEEKIILSTNDEWTVSSSASWCLTDPALGMEGSTMISVTVGNNTSVDVRSATLTFIGKKSGIQQEVKIEQAGATPFLTLDKTEIIFGNDGGNDSFIISTNDEWSVTGSISWCTVSPTNGQNGSTTITLTASQNTSNTERSATLVITNKNTGLQKSLTVIQQGESDPSDIGLDGFNDDVELGAYTLSASPSSLSFSAAGESKTISTQGNDIWTASSNKSWCTLSKASGTAGESIVVTVSKNTSSSSRSATITITGAHTSPVTVSVTQAKPEEEDSDIGRNDFDSDVNLNKK